MHARDLQIQIGQVAASFMHEQLWIEVIVERAELGLHQSERPCDEAVAGRTAYGERNVMLFAELADVISHQQQLGEPGLADCTHLCCGTFGDLAGRLATTGFVETLAETSVNAFVKTLLIGVLHRREAKQHGWAVAVFRRRIRSQWQSELDQSANFIGRCQRRR